MKTAALFLILAFFTGITSSVQAQKFMGTSVTLDLVGVYEVVSGPPKLIDEFKGRVVVLGMTDMPQLPPSVTTNPGNSEARQRLREEEKNLKERQKMHEAFCKDFDKLHARLSSNPNVRCALNFHMQAKDAPAMTLIRQVKTTSPVTISNPEKLIFDPGRNLYYFGDITVFNSMGVMTYAGKMGNDAEKAIRDALKTVQP